MNQHEGYGRVLIKLSGEALAGGRGRGLDFPFIESVCSVLARCVSNGTQIALVLGGGNFWRGAKDGAGTMERSRADHIGMLATVMNSLAVADKLEQAGVRTRVMTSVPMVTFADVYTRRGAVEALENGAVVLFGAGTGSPYFSTDTAAALRAVEIGADAKSVDAVYSADPKKDPNAVRYDHITYEEVLERHLNVMDMTATSLAMDNNVPVRVFALSDPENIARAAAGEDVGTLVESTTH